MKILILSLFICLTLFPEKASANTYFSTKNQTQNSHYRRRKKREFRQKMFNRTMNYLRNKDCTYEGNHLYLGEKGECYYYYRLSKKYIDPSYCSCYKKI